MYGRSDLQGTVELLKGLMRPLLILCVYWQKPFWYGETCTSMVSDQVDSAIYTDCTDFLWYSIDE